MEIGSRILFFQRMIYYPCGKVDGYIENEI